MVPSRPESQVSVDDILEYTSNNEELSPAEEAAQILELAEEIPADLIPQLFTPEAPAFNQYRGHHPNTNLYAISKADLTVRAGHQFVSLALPTAGMLAAATKPEVSELIPQDHPEWQNLRSGKVTGSSLAETLGLFEHCAGKALSGAGVSPYMRDHNKLVSKVASLQNPKQAPAVVDAQTQVYFDWGHKHEANGILSYLCDNPSYAVHEVGFVLMDPSLQRLPEEVRRGIDPADLPVIGSSPDGIIVQHQEAVTRQLHQHWRKSDPVHRLVLEIKAKTPFRPDAALGLWHWLGKSCKPYARILPQYFAQAQLNMLVTDSQACHLVCYTVKGGSAMFTIPLHKQWCNQMLHWVAQLNTHYIVKGFTPPENVFWEQEAYQKFVKLTKEAWPHGLASWMQSVLHQLGVDLKSLLDAPCQKALSLLAATDVVGALERVARDVKAGWPKNPSAVCMHQIRHLQPPNTPASSPGAPARSPGTATTSPGRLPTGAGAAASSPGTGSTSPGILISKGTSLPACGVAIPGPVSAQRQLWPNKGTAHVGLSPGAGPSNAGLCTSPFQGTANSPLPLRRPPVAPVSMEHFGGRPIPAAISQRVKVRLHDVVAKCNSYLSEEDFDALILDRLSKMPEWRAMSVLQQAEDANWPVVQNNTRLIMSWCKKHDS
ncbi:MAG: hypothetical protein FRX49_05835 [Trebouxia sp. A1-2]|nr:MAG: hypothetical protein FRX49_05835 [Trebouxia sp. A1-2]